MFHWRGELIKVQNYKIVPTPNDTFQLYVNGQLITQNLYDLGAELNMIQIDVCEHCFYPGCSDSGYVEVLDLGEYVVWKEPLRNQYSSLNREFMAASGIRYGSIFWSRELYTALQQEIQSLGRTVHVDGERYLMSEDVYDLWRINGSRSYSPERHDTFSLATLLENQIGMYAEDLTEEECRAWFNEAKKQRTVPNRQVIRVQEINYTMKKIVMMFDQPVYREWDCLYIDGSALYYNVGEGVVASIATN